MPLKKPRADSVLLILAAAAGAVALVAPVLLIAPIFEPHVLIGGQAAGAAARQSAIQVGRVGEALAALLPVSVAGLVGLIGARALAWGKWQGRWMMGLAAGALLILSVLTASSMGRYIFPLAFVLILAALWLQGQPRE